MTPDERLKASRERRGLHTVVRPKGTHPAAGTVSSSTFNPFCDSGGYDECHLCGEYYLAAEGHPQNGCSFVVDGPMLVLVGDAARFAARILKASSYVGPRAEPESGIVWVAVEKLQGMKVTNPKATS